MPEPRSPVVIFGASRQGVVVLETLRACGFHVEAFLDDDAATHGTVLHGVPVAGGSAWAREHAGSGLAAIVAIGNNDARAAIASCLHQLGYSLVSAVHPSATLAGEVTLGAGVLVCAGATVIGGTVLADNVVVNTAASIDHDSRIGPAAYISPGVHTAGAVCVGASSFVGAGAILGPGVRIGERAIIGAGSVVLNDIPGQVFAAGAPARIIRAVETIDWPRLLGGRRVTEQQ